MEKETIEIRFERIELHQPSRKLKGSWKVVIEDEIWDCDDGCEDIMLETRHHLTSEIGDVD